MFELMLLLLIVMLKFYDVMFALMLISECIDDVVCKVLEVNVELNDHNDIVDEDVDVDADIDKFVSDVDDDNVVDDDDVVDDVDDDNVVQGIVVPASIAASHVEDVGDDDVQCAAAVIYDTA